MDFSKVDAGDMFGRRAFLGGAAAAGAATLGLVSGRALSAQIARGGIVDVHHHLSSPGFIKAITDRKTGQVPLMRWTPAQSLEDMDKAGVATSVVSISEPGVWFGDKAAARALARETNEYAARLAADHPGRFAFFAMLPLPDVEGALIEAAYALDVLKAAGICMLTSVDGQYPGDAALAPLMSELNRRKAAIYLHPSRPNCCRGVVPGVPDTAIELATDTTRAIASVLFSGTAARNPDIRFIFSHGGGTMPFILGRFQGLGDRPEAKQYMPNGVVPELKKFYYDTAQATSGPALAALRALIPTSQILFGSDFPFATCQASAERLRSALGATEFETIGTNARAILPSLKRIA